MRTRRVLLGGGVILLSAAVMGSCLGATARTLPPTAPSVSVTTATPTAPLALPVGPLSTFGNGDYRVGPDIVAGTYRSPGAEDGMMKLALIVIKSADGTIVGGDSASDVKAPILLTVKDGQTVEVSGAQPFVLVTG